MSLAIVIPYYNIDHFDKTLFSLAYQTDKRFTVYIGNNNSPDCPRKLLKTYQEKLNIVYRKFDNEPNPITLSEQFLQCVSMISDEEWFMILGDDDILEEEVIADFYRHLPEVDKNEINVVKYSTMLINGSDNLISKIYKYSGIENSIDLYIKKINHQARSSLSEHVFRTNLFIKHKIPRYPLAWHTDDMMILLYSNFSKIYCITSSLVMIRISGKNISSWTDKYNKEKQEASIIFHSKLLALYRDKFKLEDLKDIYRVLILYMLENFNILDFMEKMKMGREHFGVEFTNNIINNIKYPVKYSINTDEVNEIAENSFVSTFCIYHEKKYNLKDFERKNEFNISWIKSTFSSPCIDQDNLNFILNESIRNEEDVIIICLDGYHFKSSYSKYDLFKYILMADFYQCDVLFFNGNKIDFMSNIQDELYWVSNIQKSNFIVVYKRFFEKMLNASWLPVDNFFDIISSLTANKLMIK